MKPQIDDLNRRLGVILWTDGDQWIGGSEYYSSLLHALKKANSDQRVRVIGLVAPGVQPAGVQSLKPFLDELHQIPEAGLLQTLQLKLQFRPQYRKGLAPFLSLIPSPIDQLARRVGIDALFAPVNLVHQIRQPGMVWVPDFQHLFMADMFSQKEIEVRNDILAVSMERARIILLSSQTALKHFRDQYPARAGMARVLRFVPKIPEAAFESNPQDVIRKYSLPERFYYLPNQFWSHKNHAVVVNALEQAVKENPELCVVCTGNLYEYRDLSFPSRLLAEISRKGLRQNLIVLGLVDRRDVYSLTRQCLGLVQPSFFEGWSTTVEEAKAFGKPIILSDLPIHREQDPPGGIFFDPQQAEPLAQILIDQWERWKPGPDPALEGKARILTEERTVEFGRKFLSYFEESLN